MTPLIRAPIVDELWWSAIARHFELLGISEAGRQQKMLVGNRRATGSPLLPRQIETARVSLQVELPAQVIIERHTVLPFYAPFTEVAKVSSAMETMTRNGHTEFALGLAAMKDYPRHLRYCDECVYEEVREHGAPVWRRSHQLSAVVVCAKHGCSLNSTAISARAATQIRKFVTVQQARHSIEPTQCHTGNVHLSWLAASASEIIHQTPPCPGPRRLATFYRERLRNRGFIDQYNRIGVETFTRAFIEDVGPILSRLQVNEPSPLDRNNWLVRLLRPRRSTQSPLHHLLLIRFLREETLPALRSALALPPTDNLRRKPPVSMKRSKRVTEQLADARRAEWNSFLTRKHTYGLREKHDSLYSWLWRNDRAWLKQHQPGRKVPL